MDKTKWAELMVGKRITGGYYEPDGDYHVIEFDDGSETSFRFMAEIVAQENREG